MLIQKLLQIFINRRFIYKPYNLLFSIIIIFKLYGNMVILYYIILNTSKLSCYQSHYFKVTNSNISNKMLKRQQRWV